ncbi:MAG TPA: hypothetical protein VK031_08890 [Tissierellaceae bacterium]|nr:hypothetical protein [Tissierellaceae bacterium]
MKLGRLLCSMSIHGIMRREEIFRKEPTYPERLKNEEDRINAIVSQYRMTSTSVKPYEKEYWGSSEEERIKEHRNLSKELLDKKVSDYYYRTNLDVELDYGGGHKVTFLADSIKIEDGKLTIKAK